MQNSNLPATEDSSPQLLIDWSDDDQHLAVPAVPVAICFAIGVMLDRNFGLSGRSWLIVGLLSMVCWGWLWAKSRHGMALFVLLAGCVCVGGARHHVFWSMRAVDDISLFASTTSKPVRLQGTLTSQPWVRIKPRESYLSAIPQLDTTICTLRCRSIQSGNASIPVTGLVRLMVTGHLLHASVGDEVFVNGLLLRPRKPANPGGFDFRNHLRSQGASAIVYVSYPQAVRCLIKPNNFPVRRVIARLREQAESMLVRQLSKETFPVALALLVGNRAEMPDDTRAMFAESGAIHLLAISGLHVGFLALLVWVGCRLCNLSTVTTTFMILSFVISYALVTNGRAPVVRATVLVVIASLGCLWNRRARLENTLAIAAIILLAWKPSDLFNPGAQLSFLSVIAIICWTRLKGIDRQTVQPEIDIQRSSFESVCLILWHWLKSGCVMTIAIWIFTAPLVAAKFHLISPIGVLINVFLLPLVGVMMCLGFGLLFCGFLLPLFTGIFATGFDAALRLLLEIVRTASRVELAHLYVSGPAEYWLAIFYILLAGVVALKVNGRLWRVARIASCCWLVFGLSVSLKPVSSDGFRCTFLSVGHGCSVLLEFPNGKTLLYDVGSIQNGNRAKRAVEALLWKRSRHRIDALVVSHADIDHFNGGPGLMRDIPVGSLFVSKLFLAQKQKSVDALFHAARTQHVPIQVIWSGDVLSLDERVKISVLHPRLEGAKQDNENSIVLLVEYAGRRILLTGDVEGQGLDRLLNFPPRQIDIMLSPHHGSRNSNSPQLANWAQPRWVIVSGSGRRKRDYLREAYSPESIILTTGRDGAITFTINPNGQIRKWQQYNSQDGNGGG